MKSVPSQRIRNLNQAPVNPYGKYTLYWMTSYRRLSWNFSLDRAIEWANELKKPLLIFEALRAGHPWACNRFHQFIIQGMQNTENQLRVSSVRYYPYVEPRQNTGQGLLKAFSKNAAVVITDDFPAFFIPNMLKKASTIVTVKMEAIDSNGLFPIRATDRLFETAYSFRRLLQKQLPPHLLQIPEKNPFSRLQIKKKASVPQTVLKKWPPTELRTILSSEAFAAFPIDHRIAPVGLIGGFKSAQQKLREFLKEKLSRYSTDRNDVMKKSSSGLSPYLHFGHISSHQIFHELMDFENWRPDQLSEKCDGRRSGWWSVSENAEAFLDQLITWRELGFNRCTLQKNYDQYRTLPSWARETLDKHALDPRPYRYTLSQFEKAQTHDPLWNATQTQLMKEGTIHNYLRMLWGKKILEWSVTPQKALKIMIELNNKYALDGRDPNSYSGISWVLGRFDRAWGPERSILGKVRYMSSESTRRKMRVDQYLQKYAS